MQGGKCMKKRYATILIASLSLISIFLSSDMLYAVGQIQEEYFPIDMAKIKLQSPLTKSEQAAQEFAILSEEFSTAIQRDLYSHTFMSKMIDFITAHPHDTMALSAKYYLAIYLLESKEKFTFREDALWSTVMKDMFTLFGEIATEFPNSWQGKLSSMMTPEIYTLMGTDRKAALDEIRRELPIYLDIQNDLEYQTFRKHIGTTVPIEITLRDLIISLELEQGNIEKAKEELTIIRQKYPNWDVRHLERNISDVYQRQHQNMSK